MTNEDQPQPDAAPAPNQTHDQIPPTREEEEIWTGCPSQWVNAHWFLLCVVVLPVLFIAAAWYWDVWWLFLFSAVPLAFYAYRYLRISTTRYTLTTERLKWHWGILSRQTEEVELYRVRDTGFVQPLIQRVVGLGTIEVTSTDERTPEIVLPAIKNAAQVREYFRETTERMRQVRGVRDIDMS